MFERIPAESVDRETGEVISFLPALDVESTLANMPTTGAGVNDAQPRLARAMFIQQAAYPGDVESAITDATMAMAERERLADRDGKPWTRATEEDIVRKRIRSVLSTTPGRALRRPSRRHPARLAMAGGARSVDRGL